MSVVTASLCSHPAGGQVHAGPHLEALHCAFGVTVRWRSGEADKGKGGPFGFHHDGQPLGLIIKHLKPHGWFIKKKPKPTKAEQPPNFPKIPPLFGVSNRKGWELQQASLQEVVSLSEAGLCFFHPRWCVTTMTVMEDMTSSESFRPQWPGCAKPKMPFQ